MFPYLPLRYTTPPQPDGLESRDSILKCWIPVVGLFKDFGTDTVWVEVSITWPVKRGPRQNRKAKVD